MAQVTITQLPNAGALTGAESVPIVQNGVTVQTTTGAIAGAGALNYPFLTVGTAAGLTEARYISTGTGLSLTDNGAGNTLQVNLTGAALSLDSSGVGFQVKSGPNTVVARSLTVGAGLGIANADGSSGDPVISLGAALQQLVSMGGTGIIAIQDGTFGKIEIEGTTNQISIADGNGGANPVVSIASNPVLPGTGSVGIPSGTDGQRSGSIGAFRYNTSMQQFEGLTDTGWNQFSLSSSVTSFSGGSTGLLPSSPTTGAIVLSGTLNAGSGGTGATSLTGYVYGNGTGAMTASTTVPTTDLSGTISNAQLANSQITINGTSVSLGGSATISAVTTNPLTFDNSGTGAVSGTTFDGSAAKTISYNTVGASPLAGSSSLTTVGTIISGTWHGNTIDNSYLTHYAVTIGTTSISLGDTSLTLGGLTSVEVTQEDRKSTRLNSSH